MAALASTLAPSADTAAPRLSVSVLRTPAELAAIRPLWEAHQQHPFADHDFFTMLCRARSPAPQPRVLVMHSSDGPGLPPRPVALLVGRLDQARVPLRVGYASLGALPMKQLCFIAGGAMGELCAQTLACFARAIDALMKQENITLAVFEGVPEQGLGQRSLRAAFGGWRQARLSPCAKHWRLDPLPATWAAFLAGKTAKHRQALTRLPRTLERDFPGRWRIQTYSAATDGPGFAEAAEVVAAGAYHRALGVGFQRNAEYEARIHLEAAQGRLRGYVLMVDDKPRAFWYCVAYRQTLHLLATAHHPDFKPYNPGTLLLMQVFQDHCGSALHCVDFGPGDADYKQRFGSHCIEEGPIQLFAPTLKGLALRCLLGALHGVNQLSRRVVDRLGLTQRLKTGWKTRLNASPASPPHDARSSA